MVATGLVLAADPAYQLGAVAYLRVNEPEAAFRNRPDDALAVSAILQDRLSEGGELQTKPVNMQAALQYRPLAAGLIAMQGLVSDANGKPAQASREMRLAHRLSRRIAPANIWLMEKASASGDVPAAVRHYHAAMAVHFELEKLLLPTLARAIAIPEVREALKPYLTQPTRWTGAFLDEASRTANAADLEVLLQPLPHGLLAKDYQGPLAAILHRLAIDQGGEAAVRFAGQIIPGFAAENLTKLDLSNETRDQRLGPLAWNLPANDLIVVDVREGQVLEVTAQPLASGLVATRDVLVQGGQNYVLTQRVFFGSEAAKAGARWSAACVRKEGVNPFWDQQVPVSQVSVRYRSIIKVPSGCTVARLILHVAGPDAQLPATVSLSELDLTLKP